MRWPLSRCAKSSRAGEVPAYGTRVQHLGLGDRPVGDPPLQAAPYDLDLGQLGHGLPRTLRGPSAAE